MTLISTSTVVSTCFPLSCAWDVCWLSNSFGSFFYPLYDVLLEYLVGTILRRTLEYFLLSHNHLFKDLSFFFFFNSYVYDLSNRIKISSHFLCADDIKIFRATKSSNDCIHARFDTDSITDVCHFYKICLLISQDKLTLNYKLRESCITRADSFKSRKEFIYSKIYFRRHVDHTFFRTITLLGLGRTLTLSFYILHCLLILYRILDLN